MYRRFIIWIFLFLSLNTYGQFNTDRLLTIGQIALHYEDYVLSIQYFNQIISLKPFLYQPWQYRSVAKFYLDDYVGSESDATEAIKLNPYIHGLYDLRAISRIRQEKYKDAIADYTQAIRIDPQQQNYWLNRAICMMNTKEYDIALLQMDTIISKWPKFANAYTLKAEIYLQKKDTTQAVKCLDKSLELDPYDSNSWTTRAYISLSWRKWREADQELSKAIHLKPNKVNNYVNRALARLNYNNLRGAMNDYDKALELDNSNFLAHYNRGLLRMQLGDDNRAIADFDYVIQLEPKNFMAIFNRALLNDRIGNLQTAIRDYSLVIDQFPNFWTGLSHRANCYRRLGQTAKAELDEFRILKAQLDKRLGVQQRWSKNKLQQMRKRSEIDPEKYNEMVVDDENKVEHAYKSDYRGQIQNKNINVSFMPMYHLSYLPYKNGVKSYQAFEREVEIFNTQAKPSRHIYVTCNPTSLNEEQTKYYFSMIDSLSAHIAVAHRIDSTHNSLLERAVAYGVLQNYDAAINDLTVYLQFDSASSIGYWQRAVYQTVMNNFDASKGIDTQLKVAKAMADFDEAIKLNSQNVYLYYDRGNLHAMNKDYSKAIDDYTIALKFDPRLAEAYYNRGLAQIFSNKKVEGIADLSKAGELGLYDAYSVIKRYSVNKNK